MDKRAELHHSINDLKQALNATFVPQFKKTLKTFHRKLKNNAPSFTVVKEEHRASGRFYHWSEERRISNTELKRIGAFPDNFDFVGNDKIIHRRIGNSVPPLFMRSIALHIRKEILNEQAN